MIQDEDTENNGEEKGNWISAILEGGLPQIIAGPAGKALSRLIGGAADIPAAWLEGFAKSHQDKTEARSQVSKLIAMKAADMAVDDPAIMERALHSMLDKSYRTQTNKEAVAKIALEELTKSPQEDDSEGPSEDWMNKFERHAEDASSDDLRLMFAKLLAGEIRTSGSISTATLHFVSMLDGDVSKLIERILPYITNEGVCYMDAVTPLLSHLEVTRLEQSGFWSAGKNLPLAYDDNGRTIIIVRNNLGILTEAPPKHSAMLKISILSKVGCDLANTINRDFAITALAEILYKSGSTKCLAGKPVQVNAGQFILQNKFEIPIL